MWTRESLVSRVRALLCNSPPSLLQTLLLCCHFVSLFSLHSFFLVSSFASMLANNLFAPFFLPACVSTWALSKTIKKSVKKSSPTMVKRERADEALASWEGWMSVDGTRLRGCYNRETGRRGGTRSRKRRPRLLTSRAIVILSLTHLARSQGKIKHVFSSLYMYTLRERRGPLMYAGT